MTTTMSLARTGLRSILIAAFCTAAATACGSGHPAGGGAAATAHPARVSLVIQVTGTGARPVHWTLRCDPAGGTHPDPQAACAALLHAKSPFAAVPAHEMCPMIPAGTKVATVRGSWFGRHVDSSFNRSGCGLPRWDKVGQIFN
jgi:hypothetical protein